MFYRLFEVGDMFTDTSQFSLAMQRSSQEAERGQY
jgi:hypothetical protein